MDNTKKDYLNGSGCKDFTAYEAIRNVEREERRKLISDLKDLAERHGYRIISTIRLAEIDNDI